jgi:serine protease inhibitor
MRHIIISAILSCLWIIMPGNAHAGTIKTPELSAADQQLTRAINEFTFDIFKEVVRAGEDTNVVLSPFSISYALGMAYNGASGTVADSIRKVLHLGTLTDQEVNNACKNLMQALIALDPKVRFEIANSVWPRRCMPGQPFLDIVRNYFDSEVRPIDPADPHACDTINNWVADKTHQRIKEIIGCPIPDQAAIYLINAIYFLSDWTSKFDDILTAQDYFQIDTDSSIICEMMKQENEYSYILNEEYQAAQIPYGNGAYRMALVSPRGEGRLDDIIDTISNKSWNNVLSGFEKGSIVLMLPKFKNGFRLDLKPILKAMGMTEAFEGNDFSRMDCIGADYIGEALHKTYIRVNEKGTEAAAVSSMRLEGLVPIPRGIELKFNRPFLFIIYEDFTGTILFIGKIEKPKWEEG